MSTFPYDPVPLTDNPGCFFTQLLRECSLEDPLASLIEEQEGQANETISECSHRATEENIVIEEFDLWRGLEEAEGEDTCPHEPHLSRATSLRLEQERKIIKFLDVFGNKAVDPTDSLVKTFSPQKRKKIVKGKK